MEGTLQLLHPSSNLSRCNLQSMVYLLPSFFLRATFIMAFARIQDLKAEIASAVLFYDEQRERGKREVLRLRNELNVELQLQDQHKIDSWRLLSDQDVIFRWETGTIDYAQVIEHVSIAERIVDAYSRLRLNTLSPASRLIQLIAEEAYVGKCKTPLDTPSWPREFSALGERNPFWYGEPPVADRFLITTEDSVEHKEHVSQKSGDPALWKPPQIIERAPSRPRKALVYISTMDAWDDWSDNEICRKWEEGSLSKDVAENESLARQLRSAYFNRSGIQCSPPLVKYIQGTAEEAVLNGYSTPKQTKAWQVLFGKLKRPDSPSENAQQSHTAVDEPTKDNDSIALSLLHNPRRISLRPTIESNNNLISPASKDEGHNVPAEIGFTYTLIEDSDTQHDLSLDTPNPSSDHRDAMEEQNLTIKVATPEVKGQFDNSSVIGSQISDLHVKTGSGRRRLHGSPAVRRSAKKTSHRQQFADEDTDSEEPLPMSKRQRRALRAEIAPHNKPGKGETKNREISLETQSDAKEDGTSDESQRMKKSRKNIAKKSNKVAKMKKKKIRKNLTKELESYNEPGFEEGEAANSGRGSRAVKIIAKESLERLDWKIPSLPAQKKSKDSRHEQLFWENDSE